MNRYTWLSVVMISSLGSQAFAEDTVNSISLNGIVSGLTADGLILANRTTEQQ